MTRYPSILLVGLLLLLYVAGACAVYTYQRATTPDPPRTTPTGMAALPGVAMGCP